MTNGRNALLKKITALSFAKDETQLFLDTHPNCTMALNYYKEVIDELDELMTEYQNMYGPLYAEGVVGDRWSWIEGKWPWQLDTEEN